MVRMMMALSTFLWVPGGLTVQLPASVSATQTDDDSKNSNTSILREAGRETGLFFDHVNGMKGEYYLPEIVGSGAALFDFDNDGDLDIYLVQGGAPGRQDGGQSPHPAEGDRLWRNESETVVPGNQTRLRFRDVTGSSGIRAHGYGMGVAAGDINNDGYLDLYVTNFGPNQLLLNNRDGTFTDVTRQSGTGDPLWGTSCTFLDIDKDGWLDLFVTNYVYFSLETNPLCYAASSARDWCGPHVFKHQPDRLFRNNRDGTFADVTVGAGLSDYGAGLGVVTADFNGDGWVDIYVANDGMPNLLWINQKNGRFINNALLSGSALNSMGQAEAGMGVDAADFDGDGDEDIFVTHLNGETNTLYLNDGSGIFEDRSLESGLGGPSFSLTGFGTSWVDYDNDGWLDLLVLNGAVHILEELTRKGDPYPLSQSNQLFRNLGTGAYEDVSGRAGSAFRIAEVSRGAAFGDVDNDGDVDVLVTNNQGPARLLLNQVGSSHPWIGFSVRNDHGGPAIGARVEVVLKDGRRIWRRVKTAGSFCSASDPRVLIGLGETGRVEATRIHWPDGQIQEWQNMAPNAYHTIKKARTDSLR